MNVTIEQDGVKRQIQGPFTICMSREDMAIIFDIFADRLRDDNWSYGWCEIRKPRQPIPCVPNLEPKPWKED